MQIKMPRITCAATKILDRPDAMPALFDTSMYLAPYSTMLNSNTFGMYAVSQEEVRHDCSCPLADDRHSSMYPDVVCAGQLKVLFRGTSTPPPARG